MRGPGEERELSRGHWKFNAARFNLFCTSAFPRGASSLCFPCCPCCSRRPSFSRLCCNHSCSGCGGAVSPFSRFRGTDDRPAACDLHRFRSDVHTGRGLLMVSLCQTVSMWRQGSLKHDDRHMQPNAVLQRRHQHELKSSVNFQLSTQRHT